MPIDRTNFDEVSEADLEELILAAVPEGQAIEYKREPYGKSDAEKKEALKDVSSFANTAGGHLIIGMQARKGIAKQLTGLPIEDADALLERMEALIRSGLQPRILGIRMRPIKLGTGGCAIVARIPKSWNPPHRVTAGGSSRFWIRNSAGAHEADVEELRVMFNLAADLQERIKSFRDDRIRRIFEGSGPVQLHGHDQQIIHIVPFSAFGQPFQVDLGKARANYQRLHPLPNSGDMPRFNLDGFVNIASGQQCFGYTQLFRNGIIEATKSGILDHWKEGKVHILPSETAAQNVVDAVTTYIEALQELGISMPLVVMVSYLDVVSAVLGANQQDVRFGEVEPLPNMNPLTLPEAIIQSHGSKADYAKCLKPTFDALWNAAGYERCNYYDNEGNWRLPQ